MRFGSLRRVKPISRSFGFDRGTPIDRFYIEDFLGRHGGPSGDIRGCVLEIGDDTYARQFGDWRGARRPDGRVTQVDVLHVDDTNPAATMVGDLAALDHVPSERFDCIICTQTLLFVYDVSAAVATLFRLLKPGGVALVTVPGISRVCRPEMDLWGDFWRFTSLSARRLFETAFGPENVRVQAAGNVLSAVAFLHGLAASELKSSELRVRDPDYEVIIAIHATKPERGA